MVEQCESMVAVEKKLKEMEIDYVRATVEEGGIQVDTENAPATLMSLFCYVM